MLATSLDLTTLDRDMGVSRVSHASLFLSVKGFSLCIAIRESLFTLYNNRSIRFEILQPRWR